MNPEACGMIMNTDASIVNHEPLAPRHEPRGMDHESPAINTACTTCNAMVTAGLVIVAEVVDEKTRSPGTIRSILVVMRGSGSRIHHARIINHEALYNRSQNISRNVREVMFRILFCRVSHPERTAPSTIQRRGTAVSFNMSSREGGFCLWTSRAILLSSPFVQQGASEQNE